MATQEVLKAIVSNGSNLVLTGGLPFEWLDELATIAATTGAQLTVSTSMPEHIIVPLSTKFGKGITFIDGLPKYAK